MGVNYNFPIIDSFFEVIVNHKHDTDDEMGIRDRYIRSAKYDKRYFPVVFKHAPAGRYAKDQTSTNFPDTLKRRWGNMIHSRYQIDKARHNLKKDWERLCKAKGSSADLRVTPQTDVYSIEDAQQTSEHNVFNFPGVQGEARKMLPIIEVIDPAFDPDYLDDDVLEAVLVEQKVGAAPVNEGDTDYSRDNYIIISVSWASLRYVVEQRHALSKHRDMKDDSVVDVVKEFERVNKSLIKEAFVQVCSYKNNMIGPDLKIIMKTQEEARNDPPESFPPTDARYWRQPTPGMRAEKCNDDNKPIVGRYKCMTTSSEPKWHGDQTLNATLCDTLVIREGHAAAVLPNQRGDDQRDSRGTGERIPQGKDTQYGTV